MIFWTLCEMGHWYGRHWQNLTENSNIWTWNLTRTHFLLCRIPEWHSKWSFICTTTTVRCLSLYSFCFFSHTIETRKWTWCSTSYLVKCFFFHLLHINFPIQHFLSHCTRSPCSYVNKGAIYMEILLNKMYTACLLHVDSPAQSCLGTRFTNHLSAHNPISLEYVKLLHEE